MLATRDILDHRLFFSPEFSDLLDPMGLMGMPAAVARIEQAVRASEPILIYGDYDVDGTTATVLLKTAIERIAPKDKPAKVSYHVPHRLREGYGMQSVRLDEAAGAGVRLVISVDTGIRAFAAADQAKALGLDLIVTDHHLPDGAAGIPEAVAVINPAQAGCSYANKNLCGAGVAFKLAHALLRSAAVTPELAKRLEQKLVPSFLKLVAIATIADSVPLIGENRTIAWLGLRELQNPVQPGLRALMQVAKMQLDRAPTATEVGFRLAPRINAAGRMDIASDVVELFLTRNAERASTLAIKLDALNLERRAKELTALEDIETQLLTLATENGEYPPECLVFDHPEWHRGVLGILASRVVERTGRPALVLTEQEGQSHGSGRSINGFHLLDVLATVHGQDAVFTRFGGHAHAVGFSLPRERLDLLRERVRTCTTERLTAEVLMPALRCDGEVAFADITPDFYRWIEQCRPFGNGHEEPVWITRSLIVAGPARVIKERHVCIPLQQEPDGPTLNAMGWSRSGGANWASRCIALAEGMRVDVAYKIFRNEHIQYGGLELHLVDLQIRGVDAPGKS